MKFSKSKYLLFILLAVLFLLQSSFCYARILEVPDIPGLPSNPTLPDYLKTIFEYIMGIGGALAVLSLVIGAARYMTSAGNPEAMSDGISRMKSSIFGLIFLLSSLIIINTINPNLTEIEINTDPVPGLVIDCGGKITSASLQVPDTTAIQSCNIAWQDGSCEENADGDKIEKATYVLYSYSDKNYKNIQSNPIRIKCPGSAGISGKSYIIVKEKPGVYFYSGSECSLTSDALPLSFGPISIDNWQKGPYASVRLVNGDNPSEGPFYGVVVFGMQNQIGGGWSHMRACGNFNCWNKIREGDLQCYDLSPQSLYNGTSVTVYQWVGYSDADVVASAGTGVDLRTEPNWTGGGKLIPSSEIGAITQIEPANYIPDYTGSAVPADEQELCENFGYHPYSIAHPATIPYHCLSSIRISGNYLLLLSFDTATGSPVQRFPISTNLLSEVLEGYTDYQTWEGPVKLQSDWYYTNGGREDWLTIIPLADRVPDEAS